jgi:uncharacterized coiled-coil DUF342 family protein
MSMEKIDAQLLEFLQKHPEYFTGKHDDKSIRSDLRADVESYARAIDPEGYEQLTQRVLEFQEHSRNKMKERMAQLVREKELHHQSLQELENEFADYEAKIQELKDEMRRYRADANTPSQSQVKNGNMDYFFLMLDIMGIVFLYLGFILSERIDISYVFLGCLLLTSGIWLHRGGWSRTIKQEALSNDLYEKIQTRFEQLQNVWKLKKLTLQQRKSDCIQKIDLINQEIRKNLHSISINSE